MAYEPIFAFDPRRVTDFACGLTWRGFSKDRAQMVKLAELFESEASPYLGKWAQGLARECRQAIAEHDRFFAENEDEELRYITETAAA